MWRKGIKVTTQDFPPPLPLAWAFLPGKDEPVAQLHKLHFRTIWRSRSIFGAIKMAGLFLLWPVTLVPRIHEAVQRNGDMVRKLTGKGPWRQGWEQALLAAQFGFRPGYYYKMEFYLPERRRRAGEYLHRFATKDSLYRMLKPDALTPVTHKGQFATYCQAHNIPVAPIIASLVQGQVVDNVISTPPARDIFVKRASSRGGAGAELWFYENDSYRNTTGLRFDGPGLMTYLLDLSRSQPYLLQERQTNHPDIADLSPSALATVRLMTAINEHGEPEAVGAVFRMAISASSAVDNFHAGGIAAAVDLATGELGPASDMGLAPSVGWVDANPATGARITGRRLPMWDDVLALPLRAHASFMDRPMIGWDVAMTPNGVEIVEANAASDVDIIQRIQRAPLARSRFAQLMLWHLVEKDGVSHGRHSNDIPAEPATTKAC